MTCNAITLHGPGAVVLVCQRRPHGPEIKHRCLLPYPGATAIREWSDR